MTINRQIVLTVRLHSTNKSDEIKKVINLIEKFWTCEFFEKFYAMISNFHKFEIGKYN